MSETKGIEYYITSYESVNLLGKRALDIANGSPSTIKDPGTDNPMLIAKLERDHKRFPMKLVRFNSSGEEIVLNPNNMFWP